MASGGYDYEFVPELLDEFICVICQLALKVPKQLEECGHRFCEACFNDMRNHSNQGNEMVCPIDRQAFTEDQVFKDKGTERSILNWKVKCQNHAYGCEWVGALNVVENHKKECHFDLKGLLNESNQALLERIKELESTVAQQSEKLSKLEKKMTSEATTRARDFKKLVKEMEQNKIDQTERKNFPIMILNHQAYLHTVVDKFAWIFHENNYCLKEDFFSPQFYYNHCSFQLSFYLGSYFVELKLWRCRGIYDDCNKYIKDSLPDGFQFNVTVTDRDGDYETVVFDSNLYTIDRGDERNTRESHVIKMERDSYIVNGFTRLDCTFECEL